MLVKKQFIFILTLLIVSSALAYQEQQGQNSNLTIWPEYPNFYANYTGQGQCTIRFNPNGNWTDPVYMEKTTDLYNESYDLNEGYHEWSVTCWDENENLALTDTVNIKPAILEEDNYGAIEWKDDNPFPTNEEENVIVDYRLASVDTSGLPPSVNTSARITLRNTELYGRPTICYKPGFDEFYTEVVGNCRDCEADGICTLVRYSDGEVVFDVAHFTSFAVTGASVASEVPELSSGAIAIIIVILGMGLFIYQKKSK